MKGHPGGTDSQNCNLRPTSQRKRKKSQSDSDDEKDEEVVLCTVEELMALQDEMDSQKTEEDVSVGEGSHKRKIDSSLNMNFGKRQRPLLTAHNSSGSCIWYNSTIVIKVA